MSGRRRLCVRRAFHRPLRERFIQRFEIRSGGAFDDVHTHAGAVEQAAVNDDLHTDVSQRIFAFGDAADLQIFQRGRDADHPFHRVQYSLDGAGTGGGVAAHVALFVAQFHRRGGNRTGSRRGMAADDLPAVGCIVAAVFDQGDDIGIVDLLFLVGQIDEIVEHPLEDFVLQIVTEFFAAVPKGVPAAVFAQHEIRADVTDVFRTHDLIRAGFLQHAVLVNAGFVSEGVLADDRFVSLNPHALNATERLGGTTPALPSPLISVEKLTVALRSPTIAKSCE